MTSASTAAGIKNMIPLNKRSKEKQKEICSKGGKTVTFRQRYAAKLSAMKRDNKDFDDQWFVQCMIDPNADVIAMKEVLHNNKSAIEPDKYITLMNQIHKTHFGEKHKIESTNTNININLSLNDDEKDNLLEMMKSRT